MLLGRGGPRASHPCCQESAWGLQAQSRLPTPASGVKLPPPALGAPGTWTCLQARDLQVARPLAGPRPLPNLLTVAPAQHL